MRPLEKLEGNFRLLSYFIYIGILTGAFGQREVQDDRCFLDGGGSTESFFVKESLPIGSLLGELRVFGDPSRNIGLRIKNEDEGSVKIEPRTKNLILTKSLDKEGIEGPSSLSFNVFCSRLGSDDPGFTIPVHIRVTDVNDNAPEFSGQLPYSLNISELTIVGSRIFSGIRATDKDQPGPFSTVEYSVVRGRYSDYVAFENPLTGSLVLTKHLDYETLRSFRVGIVARDQGTPSKESRTELILTVLDADDQNPSFYYNRYEVILPEEIDSLKGQKLVVQPQDMKAFDKDAGLNSPVFYSFNSDPNNGDYKYFELNRNTGQVYVKSRIPDNELLSPATLVVKATQFDNPDRYAVTTLTISRGGIYDSDLRFLQRNYSLKLLENVPLNSVVATLLTNKPSDRRVHFYVKDAQNSAFSVNQRGDVILRKSLDFESREVHAFEVITTDGKRNDSAVVNVTLLNINDWDPRFRYPQYEFYVSKGNAFPGYIVGKLDVHDGDKGDSVSVDIKGPYARVFEITKHRELIIKDTSYLNGTEAHVVVVAEDSGIPPRRASVPVVVKFAESFKSTQRGLTSGLHILLEENNTLVLLVFSSVLGVCFLIICCLSYYICRNRGRRRKQKDANCILYNSSSTVLGGEEDIRSNNSENQVRAYPPKGTDEARRNTHPLYPTEEESPNISGRSSSEILSSDHSDRPALNPMNPRSSSKRYSSSSKSVRSYKISPAPYPSSSSKRSMDSSLHQVLKEGIGVHNPALVVSDEIDTNGDDEENAPGALARIQWPRNSIPRRVKKLSWEDELSEDNKDRDISTYITHDSVNFSPGGSKGASRSEKSSPSMPKQVGTSLYF